MMIEKSSEQVHVGPYAGTTCIFQGYPGNYHTDHYESDAGIKVITELATGATHTFQSFAAGIFYKNQNKVKDAFNGFIQHHHCTEVAWLTHGPRVKFLYQRQNEAETRSGEFNSKKIATMFPDIPAANHHIHACLCKPGHHAYGFCEGEIVHPIKLLDGRYGFLTLNAVVHNGDDDETRRKMKIFSALGSALKSMWSTGQPNYASNNHMQPTEMQQKVFKFLKSFVVGGSLNFITLNNGAWVKTPNIDDADGWEWQLTLQELEEINNLLSPLWSQYDSDSD